jgi:hypothetical protein
MYLHCATRDIPVVPHAALDAPSPPVPPTAPAGGASPRGLYISPALRAGSMSRVGSLAPASPPQAPCRPPSGFPPLRLERVITQHYSHKPRPPPAPVAPTPAAPPLLPKGVVVVPLVTNQHAMDMRSKSGYRMRATFHAAPLSPVPKTFRSALADPNWRAAMEEEHSALLKNHTWDLVPRPAWANVVTGKWIFKHKF